jgi:AhpD family alkylhydroperoxidase
MRFIFQFILLSLVTTPAWVATSPVYKDIEKTLGSVPSFFKSVPEKAIRGAWEDMKGIQLSQGTALPGKYKELIGIAVAAQIPCKYCVYFHTEAAKLNKATDEEIKEALALSANVRRWDAIITGNDISEGQFRSDLDRIARFMSNRQLRQAQEERNVQPAPIDTPEKAYHDIEMIFGFVPEFLKVYPKNGIVGVWKELKNLEMGAETIIPSKYKDLISLAVSAQIPSSHCTYMHTLAAKMDQVSKEEISEAIAMAGITRHWSTILNGSNQNENAFRAEADKVMNFFRKNMTKEVTVR